ncbi:MAG: hypothetical protein HQ481_07825 [Alphaproteobacteria bacterium]|nr:hypothetical protein [Alphaproteobacteria bacterium]
MRAFAITALGVVLAATLASCASDTPPPPCPSAGTPATLDRVTAFREGGGRDLTEVLFDARIDGVNTICDYGKDGVAVDLAVRFVAERGPAERDRLAALRYFVAVERAFGEVTAKQIYDLPMPFEGNNRRVGRIEQIKVFVPVPANGSFSGVRVLVGFQLTAEQLDYNRASAAR